jgi:hypothetical protein
MSVKSLKKADLNGLLSFLRASLKTLALITSTPAPSPKEKGKRIF